MKITLPKNLIVSSLLTLGCASIAFAAQLILFPVQYRPIQRVTETELSSGLTVEIRTPAYIIEDSAEHGTLRMRSQLAFGGLIVESTSRDLDVSPRLFGVVPELANNEEKLFNVLASDVGDKTLELRFSLQREDARSSNAVHVVPLRTISIPITVVPTLKRRITLSVAVFGALMGLSVMALAYATRAREYERRIDQKVEQAESKAQAEPEKSKYAWDAARINLEAYFERNRLQVARFSLSP